MASNLRLSVKSVQRKVLCFSQNLNSLHTSCRVQAGHNRRLNDGQAANKTKYGLLTDLPDFSYLDGRPTPLSEGQRKRKEERITVAKRVVELIGEIQFAKENHKNRTLQKEQETREILSKKLKAKVEC